MAKSGHGNGASRLAGNKNGNGNAVARTAKEVNDRADAKGDGAVSEKAKRQALETTLGQIQKRCGQGSIMRLGQDVKIDVDVISTGSLSLDVATGIGGIPRGRVTEIFGPESSGKTTLALTVVSNAQRRGGVAAYVDAEHALDPGYAKRLGVDLDQLLVSQPDSGEQALEIVELLVASSAVDVIVVDSVAALVPRAELEGNMGDAFVGLQARLMSQALRKLTGLVHRTNTALIFINQIREKIGVMFGSPETTSGGRALKFYSSLRLDIRRIASMKEGEVAHGNRVRAKVVKNKCAPPFRQAEFDILFAKGISWEGDVLDLAVEHGIIQKSGAWFSRGSERLGQGRDRTVQLLEEKPDLAAEIEVAVLEKVLPVDGVIVPAESPVAVEAVAETN
ncbi:recombinase RecA [bacterium]|nr:recombinase RecA [bacterium]